MEAPTNSTSVRLRMMALSGLVFLGGTGHVRLVDDGSWNQPKAEPPKPPVPRIHEEKQSIPLKQRRKKLAKMLREGNRS